jgi:hypothetical protein
MRAIGMITTGLLLAAGAAVGLLAVRSLPDIKRYLAMRRM